MEWSWVMVWCAASLAFVVLHHLVRSRMPEPPQEEAVHEFRRRFRQTLRARHPEVRYLGELEGPTVVLLEIDRQQTPVPLERLMHHAQVFPEALESMVDRLLEEVREVAMELPSDHAFGEVAGRVLPQLRSMGWVGEQGRFGAGGLVAKDLGNGLGVTYVIDDRETMVFVCHAHLLQWGLDGEELHQLAVRNLARDCTGVPPGLPSSQPWIATDAEGKAATRVLLLDPDAYEGCTVAVPERDVLWVGRVEGPAREALRRQVAARYADAIRPLFPDLLRIVGGGLVAERAEAVERVPGPYDHAPHGEAAAQTKAATPSEASPEIAPDP